MKYSATCLLALLLAACGDSDHRTIQASVADDAGNSIQEAQSLDLQRGHSDFLPVRYAQPVRDQGSPLTGRVSDLEGLITDLGGRVTDREIIVELPSDVLFDFDKADIRPNAVPTLNKLARLIKQEGDGVIQVNGHTDSLGNDAYNLGLSERRAASVVEWLTAQGGIPAGRLQTQGFGESRPAASNANPDGTDNPDGRQKNRRVEVIVPRKR